MLSLDSCWGVVIHDDTRVNPGRKVCVCTSVTYPLWLLFFDSSHIAGLLALGLFLAGLHAVWHHKIKAISISYALGGLFASLATYELATTDLNFAFGFLPLAGSLMWLTVFALVYALVRATARRQINAMLLFGFMTLSGLAVAFELSSTSAVILDLANFAWWLATAVGVCVLLSFLSDRFFQRFKSDAGDMPLEVS